MAKLPKELKDKAARSESKATNVAIASGPAGALGSLIPGAAPFVLVGAALIGAAAALRAKKQHQLVIDPPRDDFDQETTIGPPTLSPHVLEDTAVEHAAVDFARTQEEMARIIEAMVTAIERASGAELANDAAMLEARTNEVADFAGLLSNLLDASSSVTGSLREALDPYSGPARINEIPPTNLAVALGDDLVAQLESMGIPRDDLTAPIEEVPEDPVGSLSVALGEAAEADYEFSVGLRHALEEGTLLEPEAGENASSST